MDQGFEAPNVVVLSTEFTPSQTQLQLLEKGLNFVPTYQLHKDQKIQLEYDLQSYHRKIDLALFFKNGHRQINKNLISRRFLPPSNWRPPQDKLPPESAVLRKQDRLTFKNSYVQVRELPNVSRDDLRELTELKQNKNIVIKPADKGNAVVIMDRDQYVFEANRQLTDKTYYMPLTKPIYTETVPLVHAILESLHKKKFITAKQKTYLKGPSEPRVRRFYILPKIHKEHEKWTVPHVIPPGRPIVSDCDSDTYATAEYIEFYLTPLSNRHPSYVKDTKHFIESVRALQVPPQALFFTIDIDSLYTNIPIEAGIQAVKNIFQKYPDPTRPDEELLQLLRINLTKNDFEFDEKYFLQIKGTAMGKRFAPAYANIFMAEWETKVLALCPKKPIHYLRYLDDIFGIWVDSESDFKLFLNILDNFDPSIRIKHTQSYDSVDFLDTTVYKGPKFAQTHKVDIKVFFKPTDKHALLHKSSFHPKTTFAGLVKSQLTRFSRICTRHIDFYHATGVLFKALRCRGYSRSFLRKCFSSFKDKSNQKHGNIIPLITTFSTPALKLNKKFKDNFDSIITKQGLLQNHSIISAYKKNSNIKQMLVRATLKPQATTFRKPDPFSNIFIHLKFVKSHHTGQIFPIEQLFSPDSSNCIYLIFCSNCGKQYVGQTGNTLRVRFTQHRYNLRHRKEIHTPFVKHFLLHGNHAVRIAGLESVHTWTERDRLKAENKWIRQLYTRHPKGLNRRFM